jgi:GDP-L-fucose synthase
MGRTRKELDLTDQRAVQDFFAIEKPEYVFLAAAHVGGIWANSTYRGDFIGQNLLIQSNVLYAARDWGVKKLLFLGSTCIYPAAARQPMREEELLTGELEYTNEPYAIAKIAGLKMCESFNLQYGTNFLAVMPTNLYGPGDNFDLERSHVLPALMRKMHLARLLQDGNTQGVEDDLKKRPVEKSLAEYGISAERVKVWGTGRPLREFLWSEDMAAACVYVMEQVDFTDLTRDMGNEVRNCHLNIGTGKEISIKELALLMAQVVGFRGEVAFDADKPDGTMRKLTDPGRIHALGWHHRVEIEEGLRRLYQWYVG